MKIDSNSWIINKPIAHRGLWNEYVPENSILAYQKAVEKNLPIEIDLYLTTDGKVVSFHDEDLRRMTGAEGKIYEKSYDELSKLRLNNTEYKIPLFTEILEIAEGKSPLLIEIKNQPNKKIIEKTLELLSEYKGEFAIQSFNPLYIKKVKKLAPQIIRGILSMTYREKNLNFFKYYIVKNMALNFLIKPDFIAYDHIDYPLKKRKTKGKKLLAWTIKSKEQEDKVRPYVDNIIFENYIPENI